MNQKIRELLTQYDSELRAAGVGIRRLEDMAEWGASLGHLRWMIATLLAEGDDWSTRKVNRWLGFIQGSFWMSGSKGIKSLRDDSRDLYDEPESSNSGPPA